MAAACAAAIGASAGCSGDPGTSITTVDDSDAVSLFNAGVALQESGDHAGAIVRYDRAIAVDAALGAAWYNRAVAKHHLGRLDEAVTDYRKAIELEPRNARALYNLGNLLIARGESEEGITMVMQATEIDPSLRGDASSTSTAAGSTG